MKYRKLNILMMLLLLIFGLTGSSLAEEYQVYAEQGDVAFFKENGKILKSAEQRFESVQPLRICTVWMRTTPPQLCRQACILS